jgi:hypothetical protein
MEALEEVLEESLEALEESLEALEESIRREITVLFKRGDVSSLSLKGEYPNYTIVVGLMKRNVVDFPKEMLIVALGNQHLPIKTHYEGVIVPY